MSAILHTLYPPTIAAPVNARRIFEGRTEGRPLARDGKHKTVLDWLRAQDGLRNCKQIADGAKMPTSRGYVKCILEELIAEGRVELVQYRNRGSWMRMYRANR